MEKGNESKIISIFALVLAVIGLSVGFAAYSSTLNITANANVEVTGTEWNVGFADYTTGNMASLTTPTPVTGSGVTNAGSLDMLKYTLSQGTAATLSNVLGSSVSYTFKIANDGEIDATLASITSSGLTCSYISNASSRVLEQDASNVGAIITAETGDLTSTDCNTMFDAVLEIDGTEYDLTSDLTQTSFSGTIDAGEDVTAVLTISATGDDPANTPMGDFTVSLGATTVVYRSATN